jgi:predicted kinase
LTLNGEVQLFDCIEFNESLRWIDVMDDLAFIHMDLAFCGRRDLAARLLNQYMELSGDHDGLAVLPYYRVHRALVRAKVMFLRARQADLPADGKAAFRRDALSYLALAHAGTRRRPVAIMITHGYSGSGKTTFARHVVQLLDAIQLRSDVERKRLHASTGAGGPESACGQPLYSDAASRLTYDRLRVLSRDVVEAGWPVIVDAAFLSTAWREAFRSLAAGMGVPFFIFDLRASRTVMASRIASRQRTGLDASDAGVAILDQQLRDAQALDGTASTIVVDTESDMNAERARAACAPVAAILGAA